MINNESNPYSTPKSDVSLEKTDSDTDEYSQLVGRGQRLAATIIDGIISTVITVGIMMPFGILDQLIDGIEPDTPTVIIVIA